MMLAIVLTCILSVQPPDPGIDSLLAETQGNAAMWRDYLSRVSGDTLECALYLLRKIPRLDRLEMTERALDDHIGGALVHAQDLPEEVFRESLLWYRVSREPVQAWRKTLADTLAGLGLTEPDSLPRWIRTNLDTLPRRFLGETQPPLSVLASGGGTETELQILLVSALRALGFPARVVTGWFSGDQGGRRSWVELWEQGGWAPLEEQDFQGLVLALEESRGAILTSRRTAVCTLVTVPPKWDGEFMLSINLPANGRYVPLDWVMPSTEGPDTLLLGEGELLLMLTRRLPSGGVEVWNKQLFTVPGTALPAVMDPDSSR